MGNAADTTSIKAGSDKQQALAGALSRYFPDLASDPAQVESIFSIASPIEAPAEINLMEPGVQCSSFLLLLGGTVRIYQQAEDGREITLYRIHPGDVCVMSLNSLMHGRVFDAFARTETEINALALSPSQFSELLGRSTAFRNHVLTSVSDRFCDMLTLFEDTVFQRVQTRLTCVLGQLFRQSGEDSVHITHQELARELGTTREVVSRMLKDLERQGCIALGRGQIFLKSPDKLANRESAGLPPTE